LPLNIGECKWLRLLALATALYVMLLPIWWYALNPLTAIAAACANFIYQLLDPQVSLSADGRSVNVLVAATQQSGFGGQTHSLLLSIDKLTYGLPMLTALVIATRADSIRAKVRALALGLIVMGSLTVPIIMVGAKMVSIELDDKIAQATMTEVGSRASFFYYSFHGYAFSQPVIAVAIWMAIVMLGFFKDRPKAATRNAACPCGSGRKYKQCCGRAFNFKRN
jgi:hypothetical protein